MSEGKVMSLLSLLERFGPLNGEAADLDPYFDDEGLGSTLIDAAEDQGLIEQRCFIDDTSEIRLTAKGRDAIARAQSAPVTGHGAETEGAGSSNG